MDWFSTDWLLTAACYFWACIIVYLTDGFALPRTIARKYRTRHSFERKTVETLARLPIIAVVFAGFFAISWRPIYAAQGTISFFIIFTSISRAKYIFIREPLVFSDIALAASVLKHKEIFYATKLNVLFWIVAASYIFGASALYYIFEPSVLPDRSGFLWIVLGLIAAFGPWVLLFFKPVNVRLVKVSEMLLRTLDVHINTVRFGTFASVVYHFIIWIGKRREELIAKMKHALYEIVYADEEIHRDGAPLVLVWQSESFVDLRHFGVSDLDLPHLDRMRSLAAQSGRMTSVFEGGYTLRTEFAVLSGIQPDDAFVDASYPYLRASHYADVVWPMRFKRAGWHTHFVHPYDRSFFFRDKAMPILGFENMTMLDAFLHTPRPDAPYVSDHQLTNRVIDIVEGIDNERPAFLFVASMENHGPWQPGRCGELNDPVDIYTELLRKADAALGHLAAYLDKLDRPVWLAFYGDHAPLLKSFADPFPDPRTDYVMVPLARAQEGRSGTSVVREEAPWNLLGTLLAYADLPVRREA